MLTLTNPAYKLSIINFLHKHWQNVNVCVRGVSAHLKQENSASYTLCRSCRWSDSIWALLKWIQSDSVSRCPCGGINAEETETDEQ